MGELKKVDCDCCFRTILVDPTWTTCECPLCHAWLRVFVYRGKHVITEPFVAGVDPVDEPRPIGGTVDDATG